MTGDFLVVILLLDISVDLSLVGPIIIPDQLEMLTG
jgi:hypothetical protein